MASRESINRIKIEEFRASRVPVDPDVDFYQGDMLCWDETGRIAAPLNASASAGTFLGLAEGQNPHLAAGVLTTNPRVSRTNIIQEGLVEIIIDENVSLKPGDLLTPSGTSPQHVKRTGASTSNEVGVVADENDFDSAAGTPVTGGDLILMRLRVPALMKRSFGS